MSLKNPVTPPGIDHGSLRLVAQQSGTIFVQNVKAIHTQIALSELISGFYHVFDILLYFRMKTAVNKKS